MYLIKFMKLLFPKQTVLNSFCLVKCAGSLLWIYMPALVMSHVVLFIFIDRSSKPRMLGRQSSKDYGMFEGEGDNLMSSEDQLRELENIRSVCPPSTLNTAVVHYIYLSCLSLWLFCYISVLTESR